VMPGSAARLLSQLGVPASAPGEEALGWGGLKVNQTLGEEGVLFPRADVEAYFAEVKVDNNKPVEAAGPSPSQGELLGIEEFARARLVVGTVRVAERVPKSKKLIRMEVDLGEGSPRQIVAGIGGQYEPATLVGRQIVVVANLKPAVLMGVESRGMLLAASAEGVPFLLSVDAEVPPGTGVK
jgi:methionyl-tRNA synthetase